MVAWLIELYVLAVVVCVLQPFLLALDVMATVIVALLNFVSIMVISQLYQF